MLRTLIALTGLLLCSSSFATTVLPVPLERMAQNAAVIFYGRVLSNEVRRDEISGRVATFTTFSVLDPIKGVDSPTYTMKQVGGQLPGSQLVTRVHGVPRFTVNQEYVVFLPEASASGFASPVGLSQGSYAVSNTASGKTVQGRAASQNLAENTKALRSVASSERKTTLADFLQNVRTLSGN